MSDRIRQIKSLRSLDDFRAHCDAIDVHLPTEASVEADGPLATPFDFTDQSAGTRQVGNRFCVLPMEGWDGTPQGAPTDLVKRRWKRFGMSGAKLIWGGEAVAVEPAGRANPHQLVIGRDTFDGLADLRRHLVEAHVAAHGSADGLVVGLQLTHSGRWSRPTGTPMPRTAHRHPVLDAKVAADAQAVLSDDELDVLVVRYLDAAVLAADAGFDFVDVKHCHGYLLHELLSARERSGAYGGTLEGRTRFLTRVVEGIRERRPDLAIGVRLSAFDPGPFSPGADNRGEPVSGPDAPALFGGVAEAGSVDLAEVHDLVRRFVELGIGLVCVTGGSPYYNPHVQRPAYFPPSDGYAPPHDPLVDVARHLSVTASLAHAHPTVQFVGSGYSYLQDHLPNVAQGVIRRDDAASIGLGRMILSYPELPTDILSGRPPQRRQVCRTFSDCTTAPRNGMISGCYPLDDYYKKRPERTDLAAIKKATRSRLGVIGPRGS